MAGKLVRTALGVLQGVLPPRRQASTGKNANHEGSSSAGNQGILSVHAPTRDQGRKPSALAL